MTATLTANLAECNPLIGGEPGGGKSSALNLITAQLAEQEAQLTERDTFPGPAEGSGPAVIPGQVVTDDEPGTPPAWPDGPGLDNPRPPESPGGQCGPFAGAAPAPTPPCAEATS
jgi:hypothetical protein